MNQMVMASMFKKIMRSLQWSQGQVKKVTLIIVLSQVPFA